MAITAGALGPLVIGGMGLGIWKLVTRAKDDSKSDDLWPLQGRETPGYGSRRGTENCISKSVFVPFSRSLAFCFYKSLETVLYGTCFNAQAYIIK